MRILSTFAILSLCGVSIAQSLNSSVTLAGTDETNDAFLVTRTATTGLLTGVASARSDYGVLRAAVDVALSGGTEFDFAQGLAQFEDLITITGGVGTGLFFSDYTVDGTLTSTGTGESRANLVWEGLPNGPEGGLATGSRTYVGTFGREFTYGVPFAIGAALNATVEFRTGGVGTGTADFMSTATLTATRVLDAGGNLVPGLTLTAASGHFYPTPVPEPATIAALALTSLLLQRRGRGGDRT